MKGYDDLKIFSCLFTFSWKSELSSGTTCACQGGKNLEKNCFGKHYAHDLGNFKTRNYLPSITDQFLTFFLNSNIYTKKNLWLKSCFSWLSIIFKIIKKHSQYLEYVSELRYIYFKCFKLNFKILLSDHSI